MPSTWVSQRPGISGEADISNKAISIGQTDLSAIQRVNPVTRRRAAAAAQRVYKLSKDIPPGWPIGFERSMYERSLPDISAHVEQGRLRELGVHYIGGIRPEVALRPPSEYGVISLLNTMDKGLITADDVANAVRLMGGDGRWRTEAATTTPFASGHFTEFCDPRDGLPRFERLVAGVTGPIDLEMVIPFATQVYFAATLIHPFRDGNGRAARALFQCVLKSGAAITSPLFPIGPAFEFNKALVLDAKYAWQVDANASPLVELIVNIVNVYCGILESEFINI